MAKQQWSGKLGVILAVAGSAVGLGNFLRFPGQAVNNGGGAFLIPYFISLLLLGLPLMWIEWTIGRFGGGFGHSTAPGMFHTLWNKNRFIKYFGVIGIFGPTVIFIYYTYIESWLLAYSFFAITGRYNACTDYQSMSDFLNAFRGLTTNSHFQGIGTAYLFFVITFAMNLWILARGIKGGIERVCKIALPALFLMAIVLMIRVFTLGTPDPAHPENNVVAGLGFLWNPDWSKLWNADAWRQFTTTPGVSPERLALLGTALNGKVWLAAAGQIFFTLSVGIGVILTYASYLSRRDDVALSGLTATSANEAAEVIMGGSIVIPAAFAFFGAAATLQASSSIFDLGFKTMPLVLLQAGYGNALGFIWFTLLFLAGITSSISLAQPAIAFLEDEFTLSRRESITIFGVITFLLCQLAIFGLGAGVVDELDFWGGTFCLVLFGTVETILFGWVFGMDKAWTELHAGSDITIPRLYRWIIRYVTPVFLLVILAAYLIQDGVPLLKLEHVKPENKLPILLTRVILILLFSLLSCMVWIAWRRKTPGPSTPPYEPRPEKSAP
jgi:SNF family Na+-dependent transporter